jgi:hypothetical protein
MRVTLFQERFQPSQDRVVGGAPGESDDAESHLLERCVPDAVVLEGGSVAVGLPAVGFDDEAVLRPIEVVASSGRSPGR